MMLENILNGKYLQERNKTRLLIASASFLLMFVFNWFLNGLVGHSLLFKFVSMGAVCLLLMTPIVLLQWDELAVVFCLLVHLYVDWYLSLKFIGIALALVLLVIMFLRRSPQHVWVLPRARGLWLLFLCVTIFPALRGYTLQDGMIYYLTNFFAAFIFFWLGIVIAQDIAHVRRFLQLLVAFGTLLAIHALIQSRTGIALFSSKYVTQSLETLSNYQLFSGSGIVRAGTFFINPDWSGTFFAIMLFIPIGLLFESPYLREKIVYGIEAFLLLSGLLATYSTGAWVAGIVALPVFLILYGTVRSRLIFLLGLLFVTGLLVILFPSQINNQLRHISSIGSLPVRLAAWQTAIRVIEAFPLTGVGLGLLAYLNRATPFRTVVSYKPLAHPHDAYLEISAMAGLPSFILFVALLLAVLWWALRNWKQADARTRSLFAGGIAAIMALNINSLSINGWTLAPLAALGWLILGVLSSSLLVKNVHQFDGPGKDEERRIS